MLIDIDIQKLLFKYKNIVLIGPKIIIQPCILQID